MYCTQNVKSTTGSALCFWFDLEEVTPRGQIDSQSRSCTDETLPRLQAAITDRDDRLTAEDGMPRRDFWGTYWDPPVQHLWGTVSLLASRHRLFAYHSFARKIFFCCTLRLWVDIFLRMRLGAHDAVKHGQ